MFQNQAQYKLYVLELGTIQVICSRTKHNTRYMFQNQAQYKLCVLELCTIQVICTKTGHNTSYMFQNQAQYKLQVLELGTIQVTKCICICSRTRHNTSYMFQNQAQYKLNVCILQISTSSVLQASSSIDHVVVPSETVEIEDTHPSCDTLSASQSTWQVTCLFSNT